MILKIRLLTALFTILGGLNLQAAPSFRFGAPQVFGDGCPAGAVAVALTEDGSVLSILFDKFLVESIKGVTPMMTQIRKTCNFRIPVQVPAAPVRIPLPAVRC